MLNGKGLSLGEEWFCGPECLEPVLRKRFAELAGATRPVESPRPARFPMGLMLFSRGYLNADQFKVALEQHRATGERIGDVALQLGYVNEEQVAAALAAQWGYPVFSMKGMPALPPTLLPVHLMEMHQMLPIQFAEDSRKLLLGFATRLDHAVVQGVEKMLACAAAPCFVAISEFRARMQAISAKRRELEFVFDRVSSGMEMAQTVKSYMIQTGAEELRFSVCREYLWARAITPRQQVDLLFRLEPSLA